MSSLRGERELDRAGIQGFVWLLSEIETLDADLRAQRVGSAALYVWFHGDARALETRARDHVTWQELLRRADAGHLPASRGWLRYAARVAADPHGVGLPLALRRMLIPLPEPLRATLAERARRGQWSRRRLEREIAIARGGLHFRAVGHGFIPWSARYRAWSAPPRNSRRSTSALSIPSSSAGYRPWSGRRGSPSTVSRRRWGA